MSHGEDRLEALIPHQLFDRALNRLRDLSPRPHQPSVKDGSLIGGILVSIHRLSHGGADRVAMHLANGFASVGIPVGIAVLRSGGEGERALLDLLHPNICVSDAGPPMGSRHLELVRGGGFLHRLVSVAQPSVVLASSNNMGLITGLSSRPQRGPSRPAYVMKTTNPVIRPEDRSRLRKIYRHRLYGRVFSNFDQILALSPEERDSLAHMYPQQKEKFRVATNPYVTAEMLSDYDRQPRSGAATILTAARMMPQKRLDVLLTAFARMKSDDCRLVILGDGPERSGLEGLARTLGIADRLSMPGFVEDILPWLRKADLFALSSDYEGLPAVVIEALACNVPVVTTDSFVAARSLLAGASRCAVVPLGDASALADAMDISLDAQPGGDLRPIARLYGFEQAFESHIDALRPFLGSS